MNDESPKSRIGRFEIQRELGRGAFGTVYLATDPQLERAVALKVPHFGSEESVKKVARFLREAKAAAGLHHPNIVAVHDAGRHGTRHYIASAFVDGMTLREVIRNMGKPSSVAAAKLIAKLANALGYANQQGVVHRDVKPENILIDKNGTPFLVDFGLARRDTEDVLQTQDGTILGTPAYMSPEQASGQGSTVDGKSDQWSLGVILYELLAGVRPFEGNSIQMMYAIQHTTLLELRKHDSSIPRDLETICQRCLAKVPADRFSDCYELGRDLERWLADESIASRRHSLVERFLRWNRRNPVAARLSVALFASVSLLGTGATIQWFRAENNAEKARYNSTQLQKSLDEVVEQRQLLSDQKASLELSSENLDRSNRDLENSNLDLKRAKNEIEQSLAELKEKQSLIELTTEEKAKAINLSDEERKKRISEESKNQKLRYFGGIQTAKLAIAAGDSEQAKQILASSNADLHSVEWDWLSNSAARYDSDFVPIDETLTQGAVAGRFMRSVHFPDLAVDSEQISQIASCPKILEVDADAKRWLFQTSTVDVLSPHIPVGYKPNQTFTKNKKGEIINPVLSGVFVAATIDASSVNGSVEHFSKVATHSWISPSGQFVACILPRVERRENPDTSFQLRVVVEAVLFDLQNKEYLPRKLDIGVVVETISFDIPGNTLFATISSPLRWHHFDGVFSQDSSRFFLLNGPDSTVRQWLMSDQSATPDSIQAISSGELSLPVTAMRCEEGRVVVAMKDRLLTLDERELKIVEDLPTKWPIVPTNGIHFSRNGKMLGLVKKLAATEKIPGSIDLVVYSRQRKSWKSCPVSSAMLTKATKIGSLLETPSARLAVAEKGVFTMDWEKPSLVTDRFGQWVSFQMPNRLQLAFQLNLKPALDKGDFVWQGTAGRKPISLKFASGSSSLILGFQDRVSVLKREPTKKSWQVDAAQILLGGNLRAVLPHSRKNLLFVAQEDRLSIYDPIGKKISAQLASTATNSVLLQTDGRVVFSDDLGQVNIVSEQDGSYLKKFRVQRLGKCALAIDRDGRYLVAAGEDRRVTLWDLNKEKLLGSVLADVPVQGLKLNSKSNLLSVVGFDNSVSVFEWPSLRRVIALNPSEEPVLWCDTTADGKRLLLANRRAVSLIDLEYGVGVLDIVSFSSPSLCLDVDESQTSVFAYGEDDRLARYSLL